MWYLQVYQITSYEAELEAHLYTFDLDGDRSFSEVERTPEAERAMSMVTSDTGRSFGLLAAGPMALFYTINWFFVLWGIKYCWLKLRMLRKDATRPWMSQRD